MADNIVVKIDRQVDTGKTIYTAWEPATNHTSVNRIKGQLYGRIGSQPPPDSVTNFQWMYRQYARAYTAITEQFPRAALGTTIRGRIIVDV